MKSTEKRDHGLDVLDAFLAESPYKQVKKGTEIIQEEINERGIEDAKIGCLNQGDFYELIIGLTTLQENHKALNTSRENNEILDTLAGGNLHIDPSVPLFSHGHIDPTNIEKIEQELKRAMESALKVLTKKNRANCLECLNYKCQYRASDAGVETLYEQPPNEAKKEASQPHKKKESDVYDKIDILLGN